MGRFAATGETTRPGKADEQILRARQVEIRRRVECARTTGPALAGHQVADALVKSAPVPGVNVLQAERRTIEAILDNLVGDRRGRALCAARSEEHTSELQ